MESNLVILAAGVSSRMKQPGSDRRAIDAELLREIAKRPKAMIRIGENGRPLLDYLLLNAWDAGYRDLVIVVSEQDTCIRSTYEAEESRRAFPGLHITFALQRIPEGRTKPMGTADALLQALRVRTDWRGRHFTVCNSDNLYSQRALALLLETSYPCAMIDYDRAALNFSAARIEQFAVIRKDDRRYLTAIIEKPTAEEYRGATDVAGRIGVSMNIFRFPYNLIHPILLRAPLNPERQEQELPEAVMMMVREQPGSVMTIPLAEEVPDLTSPDDIPLVQKYLRQNYLARFT